MISIADSRFLHQIARSLCFRINNKGEPDMAGVINYCIIVNTKDEYGAGTDNFIYMTMYGTSGTSDNFELQGHHERNGKDTFPHTYEDIGIINKITIDVKSDSPADHWTPYSIKILRATETDDESNANGFTEFIINKELSFDPEDFYATFKREPQITLSPTGEPVENTERVTLVQFDHNPGQASQMVMKYKETWTSIERILISTENCETVGVNAKVTYETPEMAIGKFSAEVGASWEKQITNIRENETQKISQREFDWTFEADPKSFVFRLQVFKVPYADQVYSDNSGNSRAIRKLHGEIIPAHMGDFLFIPRMDEGNVDPILMSELEIDWFTYMDRENIKWIKDRHLDKWLAKGWVTYDNQAPVVPAEIKAVVITDALNIREDHDPNARILGHLKEQDKVTVIDTWTQGNNIWVKLKPDAHLPQPEVQWSAMLIGKNRYIKFIDNPRE